MMNNDNDDDDDANDANNVVDANWMARACKVDFALS